MAIQSSNQMDALLKKYLNTFPEQLANKLLKEKQGFAQEPKKGKKVVLQEPKKVVGTGVIGNRNIDKTTPKDTAGALKSSVTNLPNFVSSQVTNAKEAITSPANLEAIRQKYKEIATAGKTSTRDYLYSLGSSNGISQEAIDNLLGWNDTTKEVTFNGKSLGQPDVGIDGVSYWSDTSGLDKAFNDYVNQQKTTQTPTRDYLYSLGATKGMSKEEMDKLIGWNSATGEVTFDGRTIGKPDMGVDGVSYWKDTSSLDKAFNEYVNRQGKTGKTPTRDYLYSLGASRGMSKEEIDSLIGWDNETGEVIFGGKKIGKPDWASDGVSYWADTSVLDNAFNDWVKRSGHTVDGDLIRKQHETSINDNLTDGWNTIKSDRDKYYEDYNKLMSYANQDVTKSDEYKSTYDKVMGKYDLAALQGRDNAVASGSATNGGNIDSFAAANAMRQQAALTAEGQLAAHQMGLDAYQARVNNVTNILSNLGVYQKDSWAGMNDNIALRQTEAQRLFENDETAKNNEVARQEAYSNISGTVGDTVTKALNSNIWNADGTLKNSNQDYQSAINSLEEALKSTTDENEKARILDQLRVLEAARNQKIDEQGLSYSKTYKYQNAPKTADYDLNVKQMDNALDIAKSGNETNLAIANKEAETAKAELASNERISAAELASKERMNNADNASAERIASLKKTEEDKLLTDSVVEKWADKLNNEVAEKYGSKYKAVKLKENGEYERADMDADFIIIRIYESTDLTQEEKEYLISKFGITEDELNAVYKDGHYRNR